MTPIELILEIPVHDNAETDFPDGTVLPRSGEIGRVSGLDGQQVFQLGVLLSAASVRVLRTWMLARADRLKQTRVVWNGQEFDAYTAEEVGLIVQSLEKATGEDAPGV